MKDFCLFIASVFLGLLLTGCGSICATVHIEDIDKYQDMPSFKVPVKFCITNNDKISKYCIQNYPNLFISDDISSVNIRVSVPEKEGEFWDRVYSDINFSFLLSFVSGGIFPAIATNQKKCEFKIKLLSKDIKQEFLQHEQIVSNAGILGLVLPTCQLFSSSDAVFSGRGWGIGESGFWYTKVKFNEAHLETYCRVLLHLLSTIPREEIENYYLSHLAPSVNILK